MGGSSILQYKDSPSPFYLDLQITQFKVFKDHANSLHNKRSSYRRKPPSKSGLPRPDEFPKALYILDIGHNDIDFIHGSAKELRSLIPNIMRNFYQVVQQLYNEGDRIFWIHNTDPYGCMTRSVIGYKSKNGSFDANECVKHQNAIALKFNRQLKERVFELRREFPDGKFTYVIYAVKYKLISDLKKEGFVDPMLFSSGTYNRLNITCGRQLNGPICKNTSEYISFDSFHYTQASNLWVATHSLSDSPLPMRNVCF